MSRRRDLLTLIARQQERTRQKGVMTSAGGFTSADPALCEYPLTIQLVFVPRNIGARQSPLSTNGGNASPRIDILPSGMWSVYFGNGSYSYQGLSDKLYNVVFVCQTGSTRVYINNVLLGADRTNTSARLSNYNIGFFLPSIPQRFEGEILLLRHFNYALTAAEVTRLDNNGQPLDYILPADSRTTTAAGCIAEFLPQNLRPIKATDRAAGWIDSAGQIPLNGECLAPLLESIGGYDLAINGIPTITYN